MFTYRPSLSMLPERDMLAVVMIIEIPSLLEQIH